MRQTPTGRRMVESSGKKLVQSAEIIPGTGTEGRRDGKQLAHYLPTEGHGTVRMCADSVVMTDSGSQESIRGESLGNKANGGSVRGRADNRAERGGFEPPKPVSQFNGLANRRYRPLSHLSSGGIRALRIPRDLLIGTYQRRRGGVNDEPRGLGVRGCWDARGGDVWSVLLGACVQIWSRPSPRPSPGGRGSGMAAPVCWLNACARIRIETLTPALSRRERERYCRAGGRVLGFRALCETVAAAVVYWRSGR
jgi:hypothetical protein